MSLFRLTTLFCLLAVASSRPYTGLEPRLFFAINPAAATGSSFSVGSSSVAHASSSSGIGHSLGTSTVVSSSHAQTVGISSGAPHDLKSGSVTAVSSSAASSSQSLRSFGVPLGSSDSNEFNVKGDNRTPLKIPPLANVERNVETIGSVKPVVEPQVEPAVNVNVQNGKFKATPSRSGFSSSHSTSSQTSRGVARGSEVKGAFQKGLSVNSQSRVSNHEETKPPHSSLIKTHSAVSTSCDGGVCSPLLPSKTSSIFSSAQPESIANLQPAGKHRSSVASDYSASRSSSSQHTKRTKENSSTTNAGTLLSFPDSDLSEHSATIAKSEEAFATSNTHSAESGITSSKAVSVPLGVIPGVLAPLNHNIHSSSVSQSKASSSSTFQSASSHSDTESFQTLQSPEGIINSNEPNAKPIPIISSQVVSLPSGHVAPKPVPSEFTPNEFSTSDLSGNLDSSSDYHSSGSQFGSISSVASSSQIVDDTNSELDDSNDRFTEVSTRVNRCASCDESIPFISDEPKLIGGSIGIGQSFSQASSSSGAFSSTFGGSGSGFGGGDAGSLSFTGTGAIAGSIGGGYSAGVGGFGGSQSSIGSNQGFGSGTFLTTPSVPVRPVVGISSGTFLNNPGVVVKPTVVGISSGYEGSSGYGISGGSNYHTGSLIASGNQAGSGFIAGISNRPSSTLQYGGGSTTGSGFQFSSGNLGSSVSSGSFQGLNSGHHSGFATGSGVDSGFVSGINSPSFSGVGGGLAPGAVSNSHIGLNNVQSSSNSGEFAVGGIGSSANSGANAFAGGISGGSSQFTAGAFSGSLAGSQANAQAGSFAGTDGHSTSIALGQRPVIGANFNTMTSSSSMSSSSSSSSSSGFFGSTPLGR